MLSVLLSSSFFALGIIHFHWALGGAWGFDKALPVRKSGERILNPQKIDSAIVGLGLTLFGLFYFFKSGIIEYDLPNWLVKYGGWAISIIFLLRAMGEFKYIGFFKRIKETEFGKLDTKFYSPLSLLIGLIGIILEVMI